MKWTGMYLLGYVIFVGALFAGLWKMGLLDSLGTTWTVILVALAIGFGIMMAVKGSGQKIDVDHH